MVKTIIQDKQMLFLVLFAAFFVGTAITGVFSDYEAEAKKDSNNEIFEQTTDSNFDFVVVDNTISPDGNGSITKSYD